MKNDVLEIENATIIYRNFEGVAKQNNAIGLRNFCVVLPKDLAAILEKQGWNIKKRDPRDPEDDPQYFTQIKVAYDNFPPHIVLISNGRQRLLVEADLKILDYAEIKQADIMINPYSWKVNGKQGVKGYLKSLYVTLADEDFGGKYSNVPYADNGYKDDGE
jgi:hypothetical protein